MSPLGFKAEPITSTYLQAGIGWLKTCTYPATDECSTDSALQDPKMS